jgi:SAM-dependent methyltransferase
MPYNRIDFTGIPFTGLSLFRDDKFHIKHNITHQIELNDNTVDVVQSEDVFEHIEYQDLTKVLCDIYRVLKPGGYLRMSVPDYRCDVLYERSVKDDSGSILFDAGGGGRYDAINNKVVDGGHVWFPRYETVKTLLNTTPFERYTFYHYYNEWNEPITDDIDYSKGYVQRTPDHDDRVKYPKRPMSIVVDCFKDSHNVSFS